VPRTTGATRGAGPDGGRLPRPASPLRDLAGRDGRTGERVGVAVGDRVLDLSALACRLLPKRAALFADGTLDGLLSHGPDVWAEVRAALTSWLAEPAYLRIVEPALVPAGDVVHRLPFTVADYVDFYASEHHAANLGRILRPGTEPLTPNWHAMPLGYHGRDGSVVVSGTPVPRPSGQFRDGDRVVFGPTRRLDVEAEVGFVVGTPSARGRPVPVADAAAHVFGVCLVNDWSARDVQAWAYVPLGPFLGKAFATSVSPWVVPLAALDAARVAPPARPVGVARPLPYLDAAQAGPWGLDLRLELQVNGHGEAGSLIELTLGGAEPLRLPDGTTRGFLEDGDEVTITATAPGPGGTLVGLGEVRGRVVPAASPASPG
jgi:fumarylacetoacetase